MRNQKNLKVVLSAATVVLMLAFAPSALAQSSSVETYAGQGGEVALVGSSGGGGNGSDPGTSATVNSSSLPFTGLDIGLLAGAGALLLLVGIGMTRLMPRDRKANS